MEIREGLAFDDLLITPQYSEVLSRSEVDLSVDLGKGFKFKHPITPANMKSICGKTMAECIANGGGLALLHRFMSIEEQIKLARDFITTAEDNSPYSTRRYYATHIGFSVGVQKTDYDNVKKFVNAGVKIICVDIAHGDSKLCVDMCRFISTNYPNVLLIAGNVATGSGARRLWEAGADVVKVGIGASGICLTRIEAGAGVPQMTAIMDVAEERAKIKASGALIGQRHLSIISDGGTRVASDFVKALCFSDMVMAGGVFAGTVETPGEIITVDGVSYKEYNGSSTHKKDHVEGVKAIVNIKGSANDILDKLFQGIRSGCSYSGVNNLVDLKKSPQFIRMTSAGVIESNVHDVVKVIK